MNIKESIERAFTRWGDFVYRARWPVIIAMLAMALASGSQLPKLYTDTSTENYFHRDDPARVDYDAFRDQFGRDMVVVVAIEGAEVFDLAFLRKLRELHEDLESSVPKIQQITSLINVRHTRGERDELIVDDLLGEIPGTAEELAALRDRVLAHPLYPGFVVSEDGRMAALTLETDAYSSLESGDGEFAGFEEHSAFETAEEGASKPPYITGAENSEIVRSVYAVTRRHDAPDFRIGVAGSPVIQREMSDRLREDMVTYLLASVAIIALLLLILFRRISGVVLPLGVVILSLISTLGMMASLGIPVTVPTQILPSFLLAVGVGYAVHLLVVFLRRFDAGEDRRASLIYALEHSGLPIAMTATTTTVGLFSFTTAEIYHIAVFGFVAPLGILIALLHALVFLPALVAATPFRRKAPGSPAQRRTPVDFFLQRAGALSSHHPWKTVGVGVVTLLLSVTGVTRIYVSYNPIEWLPDESPSKRATTTFDHRFGGALPFEVVIDTGRDNGLHDPDIMNGIVKLHEQVEAYRRSGSPVGRQVSLSQIVRETHQALNENHASHYVIPDSRELIAQELLLFESSGSDDLEKIVDSNFRKTRFSIKTPLTKVWDRRDFANRVERDSRQILGGDIETTVTGLAALMIRALAAVVQSLMRSYLLAFLLITPLMMLLIGSLRAGLVSMVPNLLPIVLTLGLMGWLGIPLDIFTLLIGCIAIGLAVDDTIHFIHGFQRYYGFHRDEERAVRETLDTTGRALLFTSLVLVSGFLIYSLSSMSNLVDFGLLTGFAVASAFLVDVTLTPALLVLIARTRRDRSHGKAKAGIEGVNP